jgi:hypothetical protein
LNKAPSFIKKTLKAILWVFIVLILLFVIIASLIQIPWIQNKIIHYATSIISNKTHTRVEIESIRISFPKSVVIEGLFMEDLQKDTLIYIGRAKINIAFKDLLSDKISINNFNLENASLRIIQMTADSLSNYNFLLAAFSDKTKQTKNKSPSISKWTISANNVKLKNIRFRYEDKYRGINIAAIIRNLDLKDGSVDLQKENVSIDNFYLSKSEIQYTTVDTNSVSDITIAAPIAVTVNNWKVTVKNIGFDDNSLAYMVGNKPEIENVFDVNHLKYNHLTLEATDFYYSSDTTKVSIKRFSAIDQNNFSITNLEADFGMGQHSITAKKMKVNTTNSSIVADLALQYPSLKSLKDSMSFVAINLNMENVSIKSSDVIYFNPKLIRQAFFKNKTNITTISGIVNGRMNNLKGENLVIKTGAGTILKTDFSITGLPDMETAYFDFPNLKINSGKRDIEMIAGPSIPKSIELPENIDLQIVFKGKIKSFESTMGMSSSFGDVDLFATIDKNENFRSKINVTRFDLGSLLKDKTMYGPVTLTAEVNGYGLDKDTIRANINSEISQIYLNKYIYHNLNIDGYIKGKEFDGKVNLNDENAVFDFVGLINLNRNQESFKFRLNVQGADLQKLNFTKDDIRISLIAAADLKGGSVNKLNGKAGISNLIIARGDKKYTLDSLLFASINVPNRSEFNFTSALIGIKYSGTVSPADLTSELNNFINNYFPFSDNNQIKKRSGPSNFNFEIQLHNHPILSQVLLPQLKEFEPGIIQGSFDSQKDELKLNAELKRIVYGTTEIKDLILDVNSNSDALNYIISSSSISNSQIKLDNFLLDGKLADKTIFANVSSADNKSKKLVMHSQITKHLANYKIVLDQKDFYLMNNRWDIAADNYIEFGKEGFLIHHFYINNAVSQINIASVNDQFKDDLNIAIKNFKLDDISRIIEKDTSLVKGSMDGNILFKRVNNTYGIIADAKISNLFVRNIPIGNFSIKAGNPTAGKFNIDMNLSGPDNNLAANGYFITKGGTSSIEIKTVIESLSMKTVEAFSMEQISETSGTLSGNLLIQGSPAAPEITGELVFDDAFLNPAVLNNRLELKHETLQFNNGGIYFKSFTLLDPGQQSAIIDGTVQMKQFRDLVFNLNVRAQDFLLFNTTVKDNKNFYGRMVIDSKIKINGPMTLPVVSGTLVMKKGSNFTFIVPDDKLTTDKGEGVIEFEDSIKLNPILYRAEKKAVQKSKFSGFDLSTIIEIDKLATLRLLMDPASTDSLVVRGEAALSFAMDRSGKMSLTGAYNLDEGSYLVTLRSVIKRKFDIIAGSTIIWYGDPMDAEISINAKYTVRAVPYDLVAVQMSGLSDAEKGGYKQPYTFWVLLKLRGKILHPVISFEIQLPPEDRGILGGAVNQKLNILNEDVSALNKQVFALLVLGRFVQENPLQTESGGTSSLVRSTVGSFLSAQLNKLSSKVVPGAELNFDVQSYNDYQTGVAKGRTQVEIGIKKQLFHERLSVQVGGSVDVEGERAKQNSASDIAGDVTVEYKLSEDGRYRLNAFRHNQYEGAIEGQLVESGAGIVYVRDFNKWKEFLKSPKMKRDALKKEKRNENSYNK